MKLMSLLLLLFGLFCASCTSEYEERLNEAKVLKNRLETVRKSNMNTPDVNLSEEIAKINDDIHFLAVLSGNRELFLNEIFSDYNVNSFDGSQ